MNLKSAIIFANNDLSPKVQETLEQQLYISETIDGYTFDSRILINSMYPSTIYLNNLRLLVIRDANDYSNRNLADVFLFIKNGLAEIEFQKNGPPTTTLPVANLNIERLLSFNILSYKKR